MSDKSQIAGMPYFTNPNNVETQSGSVNFAVDDHPVEHAADFGDGRVPEVGSDGLEHPSAAAFQAEVEGDDQEDDGEETADRPEDRSEWTKGHWQSRADEVGVARSGNKATVRSNVEDAERQIEEVAAMPVDEWVAEINDIDDVDDLDDARKLFGLTGVESAEVEAAFDAKQKELQEGGDNNGS